MNIGAVFAIAIGLYITIAIALNKELPYEFIWEFTRTDTFSYQFQGNSNIIRTRSLFSEPAHLGYFLNIVLTINLFSKYKDDYKLFFETFIIFGILLTLSYSSIIIMISLIILRSIMYIYNNGFKKIKINKYGLLFILIIVVASAFIMQDFLYTTLIERTIGIFNGIDNSAYNRIYNSWSYISKESLVLGNGIGHTPPIQNIYAYFLSDLGILPFIIICAFTVYVLKLNLGFGFAFILLNFSKGGYLSPIFLVFLICLFIFTFDFESEQLK